MKQKDLIKGNLYYNNHANSKWYVEYAGSERKVHILHNGCISKNGISSLTGRNPSGWGDWEQFEVELREATWEEIEWYRECMRTGVFMPFEDYIPNPAYPIF